MKPRFAFLPGLVLLILFSASTLLHAQTKTQISEQTQECLDCHEEATPGIVADWRTSLHSVMTPDMGLQKTVLKRRVSNPQIPDSLRGIVVGCYECHSLNAAAHKDNFEHMGFFINVVVSPNDCKTCHSAEFEQYVGGKKAHALENLQKNPLYHTLVETITGVKTVKEGQLVRLEATDHTKSETCYACHGTQIEVKGLKTVEVDGDEIEVPDLTGWPNQGVGRGNPDGSLGACTACHPRHNFSIVMARQPFTCSQCHLNPDVPAWEVYRESKHGNMFHTMRSEWEWANVPWVVGKDFRAPTCAACHNSLVVKPNGDIVAKRTHDFGARLWVRIFGLIYSHPQPKSGETYLIKDADGLPLPTTFTGAPAADFLIDETEQANRQIQMKKVCQSCHSSNWANGHFQKFEKTIKEADAMVLSATQLLQKAWANELADPVNPFDEALEQKWARQWLFYANSVRYGSAMSGPDYAAFKNGWWNLTENLEAFRQTVEGKVKNR